MSRIRTIKPDFFASQDVSDLSFRARLSWVGMWTQCDDHGRFKDNVKLIKAAVWPLDNVTLKDVADDLNELSAKGRIVRYNVGGQLYLAVVNWHAHQMINRPSRPKYPAPPNAVWPDDPDKTPHCDYCNAPNPRATLTEASVNPHGGLTERTNGIPAGQRLAEKLTEDSVSPHGHLMEGSREEGKGREGKGSIARARGTTAPDIFPVTPPMQAWLGANGLKQIDAARETEKFLNHHRAKGTPFKDWHSAWRNWMLKAAEFRTPAPAVGNEHPPGWEFRP